MTRLLGLIQILLLLTQPRFVNAKDMGDSCVALLQASATEVFSSAWSKNDNGWTIIFGASGVSSSVVQSSNPEFAGVLAPVKSELALKVVSTSDGNAVLARYNMGNHVEFKRVENGLVNSNNSMMTAMLHVPMSMIAAQDERILLARLTGTAKTPLMTIADVSDSKNPKQTSIGWTKFPSEGLQLVKSFNGPSYLFGPDRFYRIEPRLKGSVAREPLLLKVDSDAFADLQFQVASVHVLALPDNSFLVARQGDSRLQLLQVWIGGRVQELVNEEVTSGFVTSHLDSAGRAFVAHAGKDTIKIFEPLARSSIKMQVERENPWPHPSQPRPVEDTWYQAQWIELPDGRSLFTAAARDEGVIRIFSADDAHALLRFTLAPSAAPSWNLAEEDHLYFAVPDVNGKIAIFDLWTAIMR